MVGRHRYVTTNATLPHKPFSAACWAPCGEQSLPSLIVRNSYFQQVLDCDRPRRRANRVAHLLILPLRLTKSRSGSSRALNSAAYLSTRDHLLRIPLIDLGGIGRTKDHRGERFGLSYRVLPSHVQHPMSTVDCPTLLRPPRDQLEDRSPNIDRLHSGRGWLELTPIHFAVATDSPSWLPLKTGSWLVHGRAC